MLWLMRLLVAFLSLFLLLVWNAYAAIDNYARSISGVGNNPVAPLYGSAGSMFLRSVNYVPYDGSSPNARKVSWQALHLHEPPMSSVPLNTLYALVAKLLFIDVSNFEVNYSDTSWQFTVPQCDADFDPACSGAVNFVYNRLLSRGTSGGVPQYANNVTSFVDASFLYGSDDVVTSRLRVGQMGKMKTMSDNLPPTVNTSSLTGQPFFSQMRPRLIYDAGDLRINENPGLQALYIVLLREHNRRAEANALLEPLWNDEILFQESRKWVIGLWQKIIFHIFAPLTLGETLPKYTAYDKQVNPGTNVFFAAAASTFADTVMPGQLHFINNDGVSNNKDPLSLQEHYYDISYTNSNEIESLLLGAAITPGSQRDLFYAHELISPASGTYRDLGTYSIMRCRDLGIPNYNDARQSFSLGNVDAIQKLSNDEASNAALTELYDGRIAMLDAMLGGLAEPSTMNGTSVLGSLFHSSVKNQLTRLRDGDSFYFENENGVYDESLIKEINAFEPHNIFLSNTDLSSFPQNIFKGMKFEAKTSLYADPVAKNEGSVQNIVSSTIPLYPGFQVSIYHAHACAMFVFSLNYTTGWFGIGIGSGIAKTDMLIARFESNGSVSVNDYYAESGYPVLDTTLGGTNDIQDISVRANSGNHQRVITFYRKLATNDTYDNKFFDKDANVLSWAFSTSSESELTYHGASGCGSFNLLEIGNVSDDQQAVSQLNNNAEIIYSWSSSVQFFHSVIMLVMFLALLPLAIYIAHYHNDRSDWLDLHEKLSVAAISDVIITSILGITDSNTHSNKTHIYLGYAVTLSLVFTSIIGSLFKYEFEVVQNNYQLSRYMHIILGIGALISGIVACFLGIDYMLQTFPQFKYLRIMLGAWISVLVVLFVRAEVRLRRNDTFENMFDPNTGKYKARERTAATLKKIKNLPDFDWDDVSERIARGSLWVVIDGLIFDMLKFLALHPGGAHGILEVIGVDASEIFWGISKEQKDQVMQSAEVKKLGKNLRQNQARANRDLELSSMKIESIQKNSATLYTHSRLARVRLVSYAVGILKEGSEREYDPVRIVPPDFPMILPGKEAIMFNKPKLLTLCERELVVSKDAVNKIYRFRFKFEEEDAEIRFIPGEYINLQCVTDGNTITTRSYTPIKAYFKGFVDLMIKVYESGVLTSRLAALEIGCPVTIRGPISNRKILSKKGYMGLYDKIGMLVGGSGVTVVLQLFDYYLRFGKRDANGALVNKISVLIANNTERDIVKRKIIDDMIAESQGSIRVYYTIKNPTPSWKGYVGLIDRKKVEKLMPPPMPTITLKAKFSAESGLNTPTPGASVNEMRTPPQQTATAMTPPHRASPALVQDAAGERHGYNTPSQLVPQQATGPQAATSYSVTGSAQHEPSAGNEPHDAGRQKAGEMPTSGGLRAYAEEDETEAMTEEDAATGAEGHADAHAASSVREDNIAQTRPMLALLTQTGSGRSGAIGSLRKSPAMSPTGSMNPQLSPRVGGGGVGRHSGQLSGGALELTEEDAQTDETGELPLQKRQAEKRRNKGGVEMTNLTLVPEPRSSANRTPPHSPQSPQSPYSPQSPASPNSFFGGRGADGVSGIGNDNGSRAMVAEGIRSKSSSREAEIGGVVAAPESVVVVCGPDEFTKEAVVLLRGLGYQGHEVQIL